MYDSITQHDFDRVSGTLDKDPIQVNTNQIKATNYDNDTNIGSAKDTKNDIVDDIEHDNDNETENDIQNDRNDKGPCYAQWSIETHENENACVKAYDNMIREIEDT